MTNKRNSIGIALVLAVSGFSLPSIEREEGQTLAEYALILALIAVLVIAAVLFLSGNIQGLFSEVGSSI